MAQIQPKHILAFLSGGELAPTLRAVYFNRIRSFFAYCEKRRWLYENPTDHMARPVERSAERTIFLPKELEAILEKARVDASSAGRASRAVCADAYEPAASTGMRLGELCSRRWCDVDLERGLMSVGNVPEIGFSPKTVESKRNIPIFPRAQLVLERLRDAGDGFKPMSPVLRSPRPSVGSPFLSADWLSRRFTEHRKDAGCADGTIHSLRHSFITYCLALGIPDSKVMAMTGHRKHNTISRYTHMVDDLLQDAPHAALARYLPGYENRRKPQLLQEIARFLEGGVDDDTEPRS